MSDAVKDYLQISSLKKRADFLRLNQSGQKWISRRIVVQIAPQQALDDLTGTQARVGFTITKKVFKSAVKRNRVKRRLRAVARDVLPDLGRAGYDYVLIGRADTLEASYLDLVKDFRWCLKRLGQV